VHIIIFIIIYLHRTKNTKVKKKALMTNQAHEKHLVKQTSCV